MNLGIVGLPNVGKSTLFNAITNAGVPADNYAFCTIAPIVGVVSVTDERLNWLADVHKPKKFTPAVIEFVDIAGLVKGASKGEGGQQVPEQHPHHRCHCPCGSLLRRQQCHPCGRLPRSSA